jgi:hypothetical protein
VLVPTSKVTCSQLVGVAIPDDCKWCVQICSCGGVQVVGGMKCCETVPGTVEVARFPVETLGTHKDGNTEHNVTSTGSPTATPGNESLTKQPHSTIEGVQTKAASPAAPSSLVG